ncbi:MAG: hypothetical protein U9Q81_06980, partial [Pseudomonadota bacterium]|nr:hypothetical protein [Pseudomonadota bacterium]
MPDSHSSDLSAILVWAHPQRAELLVDSADIQTQRITASTGGYELQRTTRHNTHHHHLDGYPERVTVLRSHHPFDGQSLEVFNAVSHQ